MDGETRRLVRERAKGHCEYCRMRQEQDALYRFHIEHIVARQHGGSDESENLALACHHCNENKGTNLAGIDPLSSAVTHLFHPRRDLWQDHFELRDGLVMGMTAIGRTTAALLKMNDPGRVELRSS